ncbi:MAG: hypothetical protein E2P02_19160 [Acidobacteria bacterium]|nr:MAG: hypothetical protein E2P02_19160 [Acidobacteriota bacterium]
MNNQDGSPALSGTHGFTLFEVVVALAVTTTMIGSVFGLMAGGQTTFRRETQVADMQMSTRAGLQLLSHDLAMAGYRTPPASAIIWADSGGLQPDEITIVYADPDVPLSQPIECGGAGGPCGTIGQSSTLLLDPEAEDLTLATAENAYEEGMVLAAIELADCNNDGQVGILPFLVTQPPTITNAGGFPTLSINHNPGSLGSEINNPGGFNGQVDEDCAIIGRFRLISYRVSPPPPTGAPTLERRDLTVSGDWIPVAHNIENLQVRYGAGEDDNMMDAPAVTPSDDPLTWINRVAVTITGRTESTRLSGSSAGVFDAEDIYVRITLSSQVGLRNIINEASNRALQ